VPNVRRKLRFSVVLLLAALPTLRPAHLGAQLPIALPPADSVALLAALDELNRVHARGGWTALPAGATLRPGETHPRVRLLRERLRESGDLPSADPSAPAATGVSDLFDHTLEAAVRHFQTRHGLLVDGIVGPATLGALNVPVLARIRQLRVNLDRRRAFDPFPSLPAILVNIPAFQAWIMHDEGEVRTHRIIVGRVDRPTPLLSGRIEHIVLAPAWNVPPGILRNDKLPEIRQDPTYLDRHRMSVMDRATGRPTDASVIDWSAITASEFSARFWIRQAPGPANALGRVKFIFPNPYAVFLHDTPDRHLFDRHRRAFSSGCIRIDEAMELAERLLATGDGWTSDRLAALADSGVERWVPLATPIPIRTVYWSAWVSPDGNLHTVEDLYDLDPGFPARPREENGSDCDLPEAMQAEPGTLHRNVPPS
jgi:L,D-transpeptidase YcbB